MKEKAPKDPKPPVKFLTFNEWLEDNEEFADSEFKLTNGQLECPDCDGTGYIDVDDKDDHEFRRHMEVIYRERLRSDAKKLSEWNRIVKEEGKAS